MKTTPLWSGQFFYAELRDGSIHLKDILSTENVGDVWSIPAGSLVGNRA